MKPHKPDREVRNAHKEKHYVFLVFRAEIRVLTSDSIIIYQANMKGLSSDAVKN